MALRLNSSEVVTNGTTLVVVVPAIAFPVKERAIRLITIHNNDTAVADITVRKDKNGTKYILHRDKTLAVDGNLELPRNADAFYILDAGDESIEVVLGGAVTANELDVTAHWADEEEIAGN